MEPSNIGGTYQIRDKPAGPCTEAMLSPKAQAWRLGVSRRAADAALGAYLGSLAAGLAAWVVSGVAGA